MEHFFKIEKFTSKASYTKKKQQNLINAIYLKFLS